ncbi:hypothetical protein AMC90_PD00789 (plasmid) [Rhizobium phaseoli]|nr:hypothetical protein AMC90_PD00789 [Rhizobium phaseoli]
MRRPCLLQAACQPLLEMNIRFTATTANVDLVRDKILRHTTFVVEREAAIVAMVSVRFPWPMGENPSSTGSPSPRNSSGNRSAARCSIMSS